LFNFLLGKKKKEISKNGLVADIPFLDQEYSNNEELVENCPGNTLFLSEKKKSIVYYTNLKDRSVILKNENLDHFSLSKSGKNLPSSLEKEIKVSPLQIVHYIKNQEKNIKKYTEMKNSISNYNLKKVKKDLDRPKTRRILFPSNEELREKFGLTSSTLSSKNFEPLILTLEAWVPANSVNLSAVLVGKIGDVERKIQKNGKVEYVLNELKNMIFFSTREVEFLLLRSPLVFHEMLLNSLLLHNTKATFCKKSKRLRSCICEVVDTALQFLNLDKITYPLQEVADFYEGESSDSDFENDEEND
jgi:hypothetical protein